MNQFATKTRSIPSMTPRVLQQKIIQIFFHNLFMIFIHLISTAKFIIRFRFFPWAAACRDGMIFLTKLHLWFRISSQSSLTISSHLLTRCENYRPSGSYKARPSKLWYSPCVNITPTLHTTLPVVHTLPVVNTLPVVPPWTLITTQPRHM